MAILITTSTHQTSKPPRVKRTSNGVTVQWSGLTISLGPAEAEALAAAIRRVI